MKRIITGVVSVAVATLATGGVFLGSAHAATNAPWEPDPSSVGSLTFYDSTGAVITGGATSAPIAAYVEGSAATNATDSVATLFGFLPVKTEQPTQWTGEQLSGSTTYPNTGAPGALGTATLPLVTGAASDETVADLVSDLPNTDTSTTDGYAKAYQIRLITSAPQQGASPKYDSADIQISSNGQTWSLYSGESSTTPTTTTLAVSPTGKVAVGTSVTLTATVSPAAAAGTVTFKDGTKTLKSVAVAGGSASYSTKALTAGSHSLTAAFVPSSATYDVSTSTAHTVKVKAQATATTLKASSKKIAAGKKLTLKAAEKPAVAGKITFFDGSKKLGKPVKVKKGKATFTTKTLKKGTHTLTATFTPSDKGAAKASTSKAVKVKVKG